jgi:hypothetical protein
VLLSPGCHCALILHIVSPPALEDSHRATRREQNLHCFVGQVSNLPPPGTEVGFKIRKLAFFKVAKSSSA